MLAIVLVAVPAVAALCPMTDDCPMRVAERRAECSDGGHDGAGRMSHDRPISVPGETAPYECCSTHVAPERNAAAGETLRAPESVDPSALASAAIVDFASQVPEGVRPPWPPRPPLLPAAGSASLCILLGIFLN